MGYAFISYSTKNQASADAMRELFNKHNIDTWMAPYDIPAGSEYAEVLYDALTGCSCLVLMLTDISQNSQWVKKEVNIAITNGKTVIPVKLEDVELNSSMKLYLNDQQIVPVHVIEEASDEIQKVLNSVISLTGEIKTETIIEETLSIPRNNVNLMSKKIELTVWSPVNTDVYLNDKRHLVMKIDHNTGFDYKYNSINVSGEFELIFVSKGFEKVIAFDANSLDDKLEYRLSAILSKKEISLSYDRDEAIEQIKEEATAYAYNQLSKVGTSEDIPFLIEELTRLSSIENRDQHTNYLIANCSSALGELAVKFNKVKDVKFIVEVYETYEAKSSYGYMFEPIIKKIIDGGFLIEKDSAAVEYIADEDLNLTDGNVENSVEAHELVSEDETANSDISNDMHEKSDGIADVDIIIEATFEDKNEPSKEKVKGHLVSSYRRALAFSKDECIHPIEILMPDDTTKTFDFCDEFAVSNQKKYIVVRQKNDSNEYLFFIFRSRNGKNTLISEGQDQKKVYRWFREKHADEYMFTDDKVVMRNERKKKHFAPDTAPRLFASADEIPPILVLPDKYEHISANAFAKLNLDGKEIRQIIISESVEVIEDNAFAGLVVTEAVHIPKSVRKIGHNAFTLKEGAYIYCEGNSYVHILGHDSELIKDVPFKRTGSNKTSVVLAELSASNGVTRIKSNTLPFSAVKEEVDELYVPNGICVIDKHALDNVKVKNKIIIPSSVTRIGDYAFDLMPNAYVECDEKSYAYLYCKENGIRNSVDISSYYKSKGVCAYCGGRFSGLFKKKCSLCGKEKDY